MTITAQGIITAGAVVAALVMLLKYLAKVYDLVKHQKEQDEDIKAIKKEQAITTEAMLAALDGLQQLGANHVVPEAKSKLAAYINEKAHQ